MRLLELATPALFHRICGHQTVPTLIQLATRYGASSSSEYISHGCTTLTNSSSVWCTFGTVSTRPSLTIQLTSGVAVFVIVCGRRVDTLNKCCDNIKRLIVQPCDNKRFICVNIIWFIKFISAVNITCPLTRPVNTDYLSTSHDARWTNHDRVFQTVI